jgi:hypothetical protein
MTIHEAINQDLWAWIREFVTVPNEFYHHKFPPCPYARRALMDETVDVVVWQSGDVRAFIRQKAVEMRDSEKIGTRVMAFPPRTQWAWGISEYVECLNAELIPDNVFLNTGVAKSTKSRYPGSSDQPYFIVVANSLDAVLAGAESLRRTEYYKDWPQAHFDLVVERRARLAKRFGKV